MQTRPSLTAVDVGVHLCLPVSSYHPAPHHTCNTMSPKCIHNISPPKYQCIPIRLDTSYLEDWSSSALTGVPPPHVSCMYLFALHYPLSIPRSPRHLCVVNACGPRFPSHEQTTRAPGICDEPCGRVPCGCMRGSMGARRASLLNHYPPMLVFAPTLPNKLEYLLAVSKNLAHPLHPVHDDAKGGGWKWWECHFVLLNSHISAYTRCLAEKVCGLVRSTWGTSQGEDKPGARDKILTTKVARRARAGQTFPLSACIWWCLV